MPMASDILTKCELAFSEVFISSWTNVICKAFAHTLCRRYLLIEVCLSAKHCAKCLFPLQKE